MEISFFLQQMLGFGPDVLAMFSVCAHGAGLGWKVSQKGWEGVLGPSPSSAWLSACICFLLQTWLAVARVMEVEHVRGQSNNLDPFSGKYSWVS